MSRDFERGSSQYLSNANAVVSGPPLTMACWYKSESSTNEQTLMSIGVAGSGLNKIFMAARGDVAGDPFRIITADGVGSSSATTTTGFTAGVWAHACGVSANATDRSIYIDGGSGATNTTSRVLAGMDSTYIGSEHLATPTRYVDGLIAEAAIWNVALNTSEIAALARGVCPLRIRPSGLVAYWPIFGVGSPEPDYRGGFHMTVNAAPPQADHAPVMPPFFREDWYGEFAAAAPAAGNPWNYYAQQQ